MASETDESVLFIEVSSIQKYPHRDSTMYGYQRKEDKVICVRYETVSSMISHSIADYCGTLIRQCVRSKRILAKIRTLQLIRTFQLIRTLQLIQDISTDQDSLTDQDISTDSTDQDTSTNSTDQDTSTDH